MNTEQASKSFQEFLAILARLRGSQGCPWDREQSPHSLRPYLVEEIYELIEAINNKDAPHILEELGDVFLLLGMIAQMFDEEKKFSMTEILEEINAKLIRRHPHVFAGKEVHTVAQVLQNWKQIKTDVEGRPEKKSLLDELNKSLPPLEQAYSMQKKIAQKGFDWPDSLEPIKKIKEELQELEAPLTGSTSAKEQELGDLLFSVVNYARHLKIDPSLALAQACQKFKDRFTHVENPMIDAKELRSSSPHEKMNNYGQEMN